MCSFWEIGVQEGEECLGACEGFGGSFASRFLRLSKGWLKPRKYGNNKSLLHLPEVVLSKLFARQVECGGVCPALRSLGDPQASETGTLGPQSSAWAPWSPFLPAWRGCANSRGDDFCWGLRVFCWVVSENRWGMTKGGSVRGEWKPPVCLLS